MSSDSRITVIGAGSWGTALALVAVRAGRPVTIVARSPEAAADLARSRRSRALPSIELPSVVDVTARVETACASSAAIIFAVPSQAMRESARRVASAGGQAAVISAAKGLDLGTLQRMTEILREELPAAGDRICALSGPNLAVEVAAGKPAATVIAGSNLETAERVQDLLMAPQFRPYTNADVIGVEMAGALKNVIAIGAGMSDGLGAGDNAKAAFITRGLAEIARLGLAAGADPLTFAGLSGLGDLVATCTSPLSRNRRVGLELVKGRTLPEIEAGLGQVAEGPFAVRAARDLGDRLGVVLPITNELFAVLFETKSPLDAISDLMGRDAKHELDDILPLKRLSTALRDA